MGRNEGYRLLFDNGMRVGEDVIKWAVEWSATSFPSQFILLSAAISILAIYLRAPNQF